VSFPRIILHADMDAFYASIEQRDHPELRGRPVMVGGDSSRGVVAAASYEARVFGVHSAMPSALARRLCPDGVFVRGDMARYTRESKRIFEIFRRFTPAVEGLSLDEAFLDLTGTSRLHGPPASVGGALRRAVREETRLPVSVGIAPVKMVAKIASAAAKPDGLLEVASGSVRAFLDPLPVRRIWGVGAVAEERLARCGFHTLGDLARAEPAQLRRLLGPWGTEIGSLARGEDLREVEAYREAVSMSEENTFAEDVQDFDRLLAALLTHAEAVARRMRRARMTARTVVLKLKLARRVSAGPRGFPLLTRRATLPEPTDDGETVASVARTLLERWGLPEPVRLLGVGVTNLEEGRPQQLSLFAETSGARPRDRLNRALDEITARFGRGAVVRAIEAPLERAGLSFQIKRGENEPDTER
jgi:DNA polymerase-4